MRTIYENEFNRWVVSAVRMNLMLLLNNLYAVFRISDYGSHSQRSYYLASSWIIFAIPVSIILLLLITPYPGILKKRRTAVGERRRCKSIVPFLVIRKLVDLQK